MKKIFTLMTLLMLSMATWAAVGDIYEIVLNGSNVVKLNGSEIDATEFITWNSEKHNFNSKFKDCTYAGVTFTKGLKMEGATKVEWTAVAESRVTIVQSTWGTSTIKFNGEELDRATANTDTDGALIYTVENVPAGTSSVTRGSGESGLFYIRIDYTGEAKTQLETPVIEFDAATGAVIINTPSGASEVRYTTDGTNPGTEVGEVYTDMFTVEDGTTVKAIAIGEGNFVNSAIASALVLIDGITVKAPVIKQQNGTVYIKSETIGSSIEYSLDQQNWKNGDRAFTLFESATVYARALRANSTTSEVVSAQVNVNKAPTNTEKIYFFYENPDNYKMWGYCNENVIEGQGDYYGYELSISGNTTKNWSAADAVIVPGISIDGMTFAGDSVTTLKLSNGAQNTIQLADGKKAVRLTLYSYVNGAAGAVAGWQEVNGVTYDYAEIPMCCFSDLRRDELVPDTLDANGQPVYKKVKDMAGNADVRIYDLDFVEDKITFTNKGVQLCFVAVVDIATDKTVVDHTGISELVATAAQKKGAVYNLAGQKVAAGYRGVAIRDGKKLLLK